MNKSIFVIDAYSLLYKAFFGVRPMHSTDGTPTNAIYGFVNMLVKLTKDHSPDYMFAAFDAGKHTFRHELYKDYKAGRQQMPEELRAQVPIVVELLKAAGVAFLECKDYEADDIIGYVSALSEKNGDHTTVITGDRDSFQLVGDSTEIMYAKKGVSDTVNVDKKYLADTYGLTPIQMIDLKALMGDKSDNIPGIAGIGEKTALGLIHDYNSLDGVYKNIDSIKGKLKEKLENGKNDAYLSKELGTIKRQVPIELNYENADDYDFAAEEVIKILNKYELKSLIKNIGVSQGNVESNSFVCSEPVVGEFELALLQGKTVGVQLSDNDITLHPCMAVSTGGKNYLVENAELSFIKDFFEDGQIIKTVHDYKEIYKALLINSIHPKSVIFDTFVAGYVVNPSDERYGLDTLAKKYLDIEISESSKPKQQSFFDIIDTVDKNLLVQKSCVVLSLYHKFKEIFKEEALDELYENIEHRLIFILAEMELVGFKVDMNMLYRLEDDFSGRIAALTHDILQMANKDIVFNINSTKQLGELLFDEMGLPVVKKTKSGYSTDIEVLEKIKNTHPIIPKIIELRKISKLSSTYVKGLIKLADDKSRIHTTFNQTITTTGRISSSAPNLQNIPVKTEEGRVIRKIFVPSNDERILIDADYSQIELRVLAHISGDKNMIASFENGEDIHSRTASEVFGVPLSKVTNAQRSSAKAVNFGIVYGISDFGLSKNLNIAKKDAKIYIDTYLAKFADVKKYMVDIVDFARKHGYVETLFGRRRYIGGIASANANIRAFAERTAMNTPIQGTAADIIKIAMINVGERLKKEKLKSELILQVHDELIIDCCKEEQQKVAALLKEEMENAVALNVPLTVQVACGKSWYEAK